MSFTAKLVRIAAILGLACVALLGATLLPGAKAQASTPVEIVGLGSGKCVDIRAEDGTDHARAQIWQCYGTPNQRFTFVRVGTTATTASVYELASQAGNGCLQVKGASSANGAGVERSTCNSGDVNQMWSWYGSTHGTGTLALRNLHSGKCLDVNGNSTENGAAVQQWDCNDTSAQRWTYNTGGA